MCVCVCVYVVTGHVTSGSLKTPAEADKESLQARWLSADIEKLKQEVELRLESHKHVFGVKAHSTCVFFTFYLR